MEEYERKRLLERIGRESATVGASIPETLDLNGESFPLREFVFEVQRVDAVASERRESVEEAKRALRRARRDRAQRLEAGDVDVDEGERLAGEVIGIDRALGALESLDEETDVEAEAARAETADRKRWYAFLTEATGSDETTRGGRSGRGRGRGG